MPGPATARTREIPPPLRAELLGPERLAEEARRIASSQHIAEAGRIRTTPLLALTQRAADELDSDNEALVQASRSARALSPGGEWLLDNHYLVEEQVREIREDLPAGYGMELPRVADGPNAALPRIYDALLSLVSHTDSRLDREVLVQFMDAYQEVAPCTIGECWAVPIMLRVAFVENIRRLSRSVVETHRDEAAADTWWERLALAEQNQSPEALAQVLARLSAEPRANSPVFLLRLAQRLQASEVSAEPSNAWLGRRLSGLGIDLDREAIRHQQRQAADQISIANCIGSIRLLDALDWTEFFERISTVERVLRRDPVGAYERMDFASRDRYRHALEELAKRSTLTEAELADLVVSKAQTALSADAGDDVGGHVGFWLVRGGRYELEREIAYKPKFRERMFRGPLRHRGVFYWGLLALTTFIFIGGLVVYSISAGAVGWRLGLLLILAIIPLSDLGLALTNRISAAVFLPRALPKFDATHSVPEEHRSMVVVPSLLLSVKQVREVISNLEIAYLANRDPNIGYTFLGDPTLSSTEVAPGDAAVQEAATRGIEELNERYEGEDGRRPFHLMLRNRRWSETEQAWMGWERKRGFLDEFVRELRGDRDTTVFTRVGDPEWRRGVTFVLTLDADTVLPRDSAKRLIATISHPLNRARWHPGEGHVRAGYGLVQPRVGMSLPGAHRSRFSYLYSSGTGIDPYANAISDTYQDVFGEGSFTGKGIFEVDVYLGVLRGAFPENSVLSHDLLEGCFLRTGLASDIEVIDDYPANYLSSTKRLHRWARGDWQIGPWLFGRVKNESDETLRNPLSALHRWKIADNLRRTLVAPFTIVLFTIGWLLLPGTAAAWPFFLVLVVLFPAYFALADSMIFKPPSVSFRSSAPDVFHDFGIDSERGLFNFALLPHHAWVMSDAIVRTVWRMLVTRKHMLEWVTAAEAESHVAHTLSGFARSMASSTIVGVALLVLGTGFDATRGAIAFPFVVIWVGAPLLAWWVSEPIPEEQAALNSKQRQTLRRTARKTWRFFDTFVVPEGHHLAPDNFQEDPRGEVAWRTSPTNMGLQLLAYLSAYDLGYHTVESLMTQTTRTLTAMVGLERYHGHFYNWYDIRTLEPLRPAYVSTVDSGNLAGHLLTVRVGLLEASESPLVGKQLLDGARDTVALALEELNEQREEIGPADAVRNLREALDAFARTLQLAESPGNLGEWSALLRRLEINAAEIDTMCAVLVTPEAGDVEQAEHFWPTTPIERVRKACADANAAVREPLQLIDSLAPWAELLLAAPPGGRGRPDLRPLLAFVPSVVGIAEGLDRALDALDDLARIAEDRATREWAIELAEGVRAGRPLASQLLGQLRLNADIAREMWEHTDFTMLFDEQRLLFSIGYNLTAGTLDASFYDLLASEARLASFLAVAKGDVPQEHWFRLGRSLTDAGTGRALVSWSGSMFEYFMPLLVMQTWPSTILDETYRTVVKRQRQYGATRGVPWGVSESAFNAKDAELTYQYQAFGVPGLGLKRGLGDDVVVAPYASLLALPIDPASVVANLATFSAESAEGPYGYYEALDYTPGRVPAGERRAVVKAYFAHHQGMVFAALTNEICGNTLRDRFHRDPIVASADLLLQERVPRGVELVRPHVQEVRFVRSVRELPPPVARFYRTAETPVPATHFLSNGRYSVMVTNGGGGYSRWKGVAVTRYREDVTRDCWGQFFYIRDVVSGDVFSAPHNPWPADPDEYRVSFAPDKAEFRRVDGELETAVEVAVSPEDDVEIRRITITNRGFGRRRLEVTSYFEIGMTAQAGDQAHRAFSNLFVETEPLPDTNAVLFSRRPRSDEEERHWGFHQVACEQQPCDCSFETDRAAFLGRLKGAERPAALEYSGPLGGRSGAVLDPCAAIRRTLRVNPGESVRLVYITGVANTREDARRLTERYFDPRSAQRVIDLAWTASQVELRDLGITPEDAVALERLASRLVLTDPYSPLKVKTPRENELQVNGLWSLGISGDYPILLVRVEETEHAPLVRRALLAHQYWRHKGLLVDLVVMNTKPSGYSDELDERLKLLMRTGHALQLLDKPGGVYLRRADQMHPDVLNLLVSTARAVLDGDAGSIELQLNRRGRRPEPGPELRPPSAPVLDLVPSTPRPRLAFDNGTGGFDAETGDYVIVLEEGNNTPAPWVNVMGFSDFGCMVSEAGVGCTWALNSHENRITTWNNDPVSDGSGEALYLRDEDTGEFWSPTPLPCRATGTYSVRHSPGVSRFDHAAHGIDTTLHWFADADDPVRVVRLKLCNVTGRPRRITVTQFVEWSLGSSRSAAQQRVVTWFDAEHDMLTAHNWFNPDFPGRPAFLACDHELRSWTASRTEFVGRNGRASSPAALHARDLAGASGRFHDNCGALMAEILLEPHGETEVAFFLGQADNIDAAREVVSRFREPGAVDEALATVKARWDELLGVVQVNTPDAGLDLMLNRWLLYQTVSCRIRGRTATYQSSGAFGFRDQLQDVLAMLVADPAATRAQIVEASRRQFAEGDVLHWWQPYSGRGVRTHISDDRLWLPYAVSEYLDATGDESVLDERTPFIEAQPLAPEDEDAYVQPAVSETAATVYEHCVRAIEASRAVGEHGLPLMGGGDWNDGMNRVGHQGKGESVWLAWFIGDVLTKFANVAERRGEPERAEDYRAWAKQLAQAAEENGWDGSWYRRAYFDDGTPLGTRDAAECRIDAIAQSWATISGLADPARAREALEAVDEKLVSREDGLIRLLTPPFDKTRRDPGYIKGYLPGVRENGGQYTHAASWVILAYLMQGDGETALDLLRLVNPISHSLTAGDIARYRVEPYVVAADVYAVEPHVGRGGWTWYTGAAGWLYRVAIQHMLGLRILSRDGQDTLIVDPCIPKAWPSYSMTLRRGSSEWNIHVENPRGVNRGVARVEVDGHALKEREVPLTDDGKSHEVVVRLLGG